MLARLASAATSRPTVKKIVGSGSKLDIGTPSISAALRGELKQDSRKEEEIKPEVYKSSSGEDKPFNIDQVKSLWTQFSERYKENVTIYNLLQIVPTLDGNIVNVIVSNSVMQDKFRQIKPELVGYLSRNLENSLVDIEISIVKEKIESTTVTDEQKLKKMMSENPVFMEMKNMFNLDFDG